MAQKPTGVLAESLQVALAMCRAQREAGVSAEERRLGLEKTLRACWPQVREWRYLCDACRDIGLIIRNCGGTMKDCGRRQLHAPHEYGVPCSCKEGLKYRPKTAGADDHVTAAKQGRKFSRFGR